MPTSPANGTAPDRREPASTRRTAGNAAHDGSWHKCPGTANSSGSTGNSGSGSTGTAALSTGSAPAAANRAGGTSSGRIDGVATKGGPDTPADLS